MPVKGNSQDRFDGWRTQPLYTFGEVAHLAHVSPGTVRNWILGYTTKQRDVPPLFTASRDQTAHCSFLQPIEIVVATQFRKAGHVSFKTVRNAYDNARQEWKLDYPFARLELRALGGHIVHIVRQSEPGSSLQSLDQLDQWTLPGLVQETIDQLDYESDLAARWYPVGKKVPIVIDPRISAGLPVITGHGVMIEVVHKRFKAGQKIDFIAKDFEIDSDVVEDVVRYAEKVAA